MEKSFEMCDIFNMDETPVWFDMAGNFTVNQKAETRHIYEEQAMKKIDLLSFLRVLLVSFWNYLFWFSRFWNLQILDLD